MQQKKNNKRGGGVMRKMCTPDSGEPQIGAWRIRWRDRRGASSSRLGSERDPTWWNRREGKRVRVSCPILSNRRPPRRRTRRPTRRWCEPCAFRRGQNGNLTPEGEQGGEERAWWWWVSSSWGSKCRMQNAVEKEACVVFTEWNCR